MKIIIGELTLSVEYRKIPRDNWGTNEIISWLVYDVKMNTEHISVISQYLNCNSMAKFIDSCFDVFVDFTQIPLDRSKIISHLLFR